ncbi:hypothetical protein Bhyg_02562 [Pseudolycoriella hygida]|uniref:Tyr recombinase domain-containing protein n=1 Tax=Pseudolycoriella hygida TaxID=35572 RepID=A0A9Q0NBM8_9DIPT|nr:hypothetical protein Bhyg_02562 [Pseudolycoriella hygida]
MASLDEEAHNIVSSSLPGEAKEKYVKNDNTFMEWHRTRGIEENDFSEKVMLVYLDHLHNNNMLRHPFGAFIRCYAPRSSVITTCISIIRRVILVLKIYGATRADELTKLLTKDIEVQGAVYLVKIPDTKNKFPRSFTIEQEYAAFVHPNSYTGHSFRRSSTTLLVEGGADLVTVKRHAGWRSSSAAEGYIQNSVKNKRRIGSLIANQIASSSTVNAIASSSTIASTNMSSLGPST